MNPRDCILGRDLEVCILMHPSKSTARIGFCIVGSYLFEHTHHRLDVLVIVNHQVAVSIIDPPDKVIPRMCKALRDCGQHESDDSVSLFDGTN